jgi:hypothetical protein
MLGQSRRLRKRTKVNFSPTEILGELAFVRPNMHAPESFLRHGSACEGISFYMHTHARADALLEKRPQVGPVASNSDSLCPR